MKMKWDFKSTMAGLIIGFVLALVMLALISIVFAQGTIQPPCPIFLKLVTVPEGSNIGLTVVLKDTDGTVVMQKSSNEYGEVLFELGGIAECKAYKATILECDDIPECSRMVEFNPLGFTTWDITAVEVPCPACNSCCPSCPICEDCPITTTVTTTIPEDYCVNEGYILPEDCEDVICPDWELSWTNVLAAFVGAITAGFAVYVKGGKLKLAKKKIEELVQAMPKGCGLRLFHAYSGQSELKHVHRSPKSYHSLDKRHKGKYDHNGEENLFPDF